MTTEAAATDATTNQTTWLVTTGGMSFPNQFVALFFVDDSGTGAITGASLMYV